MSQEARRRAALWRERRELLGKATVVALGLITIAAIAFKAIEL